MGAFSIWHWLIVLVVVLVLFGGRGKLSGLMGDMAKGINAFKKGLKEGDVTDKGDRLVVRVGGASVTIAKHRVQRIEKKATVRDGYREKLAKATTAADHYTLAQWCRKNGLTVEYKLELAQVVALNAGHAAAPVAPSSSIGKFSIPAERFAMPSRSAAE